MNDQWLFSSFAASSLIHLALIPAAALVIQIRPPEPTLVPIELVNVPRDEEVKEPEPAPPPPKPKAPKITAPKLLSKPEFETKPLPPTGNTKEEVKEPEPVPEPLPPLASLPPDPGPVKGGWNPAPRPGEAEGGAAGAANLFAQGDVGVVGGNGVEGGGGGQSKSGLGRGTKGDGAGGGGGGSGEALSGLARPLGGYQVKPRYPESARRAGAQGVTMLRVRVLENGKVGDMFIDKSAGFRDLDFAAMEAVKKWLFEPARRGKEPVSVWVLLPVKFELH
jgi:periplasmic protein TonB